MTEYSTDYYTIITLSNGMEFDINVETEESVITILDESKGKWAKFERYPTGTITVYSGDVIAVRASNYMHRPIHEMIPF